MIVDHCNTQHKKNKIRVLEDFPQFPTEIEREGNIGVGESSESREAKGLGLHGGLLLTRDEGVKCKKMEKVFWKGVGRAFQYSDRGVPGN